MGTSCVDRSCQEFSERIKSSDIQLYMKVKTQAKLKQCINDEEKSINGISDACSKTKFEMTTNRMSSSQVIKNSGNISEADADALAASMSEVSLTKEKDKPIDDSLLIPRGPMDNSKFHYQTKKPYERIPNMASFNSNMSPSSEQSTNLYNIPVQDHFIRGDQSFPQSSNEHQTNGGVATNSPVAIIPDSCNFMLATTKTYHSDFNGKSDTSNYLLEKNISIGGNDSLCQSKHRTNSYSNTHECISTATDIGAVNESLDTFKSSVKSGNNSTFFHQANGVIANDSSFSCGSTVSKTVIDGNMSHGLELLSNGDEIPSSLKDLNFNSWTDKNISVSLSDAMISSIPSNTGTLAFNIDLTDGTDVEMACSINSLGIQPHSNGWENQEMFNISKSNDYSENNRYSLDFNEISNQLDDSSNSNNHFNDYSANKACSGTISDHDFPAMNQNISSVQSELFFSKKETGRSYPFSSEISSSNDYSNPPTTDTNQSTDCSNFIFQKSNNCNLQKCCSKPDNGANISLNSVANIHPNGSSSGAYEIAHTSPAYCPIQYSPFTSPVSILPTNENVMMLGSGDIYPSDEAVCNFQSNNNCPQTPLENTVFQNHHIQSPVELTSPIYHKMSTSVPPVPSTLGSQSRASPSTDYASPTVTPHLQSNTFNQANILHLSPVNLNLQLCTSLATDKIIIQERITPNGIQASPPSFSKDISMETGKTQTKSKDQVKQNTCISSPRRIYPALPENDSVPAIVQIMNRVNEEERKKIQMSCLRGKLEMLIQPDSDNDTPLHICIANKLMVQAVFLLERFIQENVDFDIPNRWGLTPLFVAVDLAKDPAMVTYLLEKGSNPNISMKKCGRSPLHVAAQGKQNCLPIVKALLKCETTNILARNDKGETALHDAVRNHNVRRKLNEVSNEMYKVDSIPVVQQLLAHANGQKLINEISNDNLSAFNIAMESGEVSIELLKLLSRNGAEISDTDKKMIKKYCPKFQSYISRSRK